MKKQSQMSKELNNRLIQLLRKDYPDIDGDVEELLYSDENFKDLVQDFFLCSKEIDHLKSMNKNRLLEEYNSLLKDLKTEIAAYLKP